MRYVFIQNPVAGKNGSTQAAVEAIAEHCRRLDLPAVFYRTEYAGHARELARKEAAAGDEVRIYAIGGDGTLNETADGAAGYPNAAVGIFPCGSGNDFIRTFAGEQDTQAFLDVARQLSAPVRVLDSIDAGERSALNVCSIGLDAQVAHHMSKFKRLPFISGSMAYNLSLVMCLFGRLGNELTMTTDKGEVYQGQYLFALAANGCWYGGGYHCAPLALPDDGKLDFILIKNPGLLRLISLVGAYKNGRHLADPRFKELVTFLRGESMRVQARQTAHCNFDGECVALQEAVFTVRPAAFRFIDPVRCVQEEKTV